MPFKMSKSWCFLQSKEVWSGMVFVEWQQPRKHFFSEGKQRLPEIDYKDRHEGQWKWVLCGNKSKVWVQSSTTSRKSWKELGEKTLWPLVKHGEWSVQVWGSISASGVEDIVRIDGVMNAAKYRQVLNDQSFLTDNDLKHTANAGKSHLKTETADKSSTVLDWPPQSTALNIIKQAWDHMEWKKQRTT